MQGGRRSCGNFSLVYHYYGVYGRLRSTEQSKELIRLVILQGKEVELALTIPRENELHRTGTEVAVAIKKDYRMLFDKSTV